MEGFFPVSRFHADLMRDRLDLPVEKVMTLHNGIDLAPFSPRDDVPHPPVIGFLARLCPIKGLGTVVDAFLTLKREERIPGLRLHIAGTETRANRLYVAEQRNRIRRAGLSDDVSIRTNLSLPEKVEFLRGLSVLSVPATYGESFGLYLIEAMACGVPVVQPNHAAFPEILEATGGGRLYAWDDPSAYANALEELIADTDLNQRLGEAGREAVRPRFSIEHMAEEFERLLEELGLGPILLT
jgi:glycosyltransferase involved in cell wall biosynthesis